MQDRQDRLDAINLGAWTWVPGGGESGATPGNAPRIMAGLKLRKILEADKQAASAGTAFAPLPRQERVRGMSGRPGCCLVSLVTLPIAPFLINRDRRNLGRARMNGALQAVETVRQEYTDGVIDTDELVAFVDEAIHMLAHPLHYNPDRPREA